jgi:two-component system chemotaxis sensor kinase CheA
MIDRFKDNFREEAFELLASLEQSLLRLEEVPDDKDEISAVFRAVHTIKGSAAMFGFQHISEFTHELENILDGVRAGKISVSQELIDITLQARDHVKELLAHSDDVPEELKKVSRLILDSFHEVVPKTTDKSGQTAKPGATAPDAVAGAGLLDQVRTWRIRFTPNPGIMRNGTKPLQLIHELAGLGELTVIPFLTGLPELEAFQFDLCYFRWDIMLTTSAGQDQIMDVFIFVQDAATIELSVVDTPMDGGTERLQLGKILVDRGVADAEQIEQLVSQQRRLGDLLEADGVARKDIKAALEEQDHIKRTRQRVQQEVNVNSIRVSSDKLDILVDLVGELVTLQARLAQSAQGWQNSELSGISEQLERLTNELRDQTMSVRMLPIGSTFSKFKRLVRDLAKDLGKEVDLVTEGADTELDKTVLERLNDPLVHIIRNSLDHGLEDSESRRKAGKPESGTITLSARHAGATVSISVADDGRGLDTDAIRRKAIEKGLIGASQEISVEDIRKLIFQPGFSTAKQVTSVSGRGVGMDVVKKELENLGGVIRIDSTPGSGTCIQLDIPLTLAIIDGLLVCVGDEHYVVPLSLVEECLECDKAAVRQGQNGFLLPHRGQMLPVIGLRDQFGCGTSGTSPVEQIVVVNWQGQKVGMVVDKVIGDHQTVIKNLGRMYRDADAVSGATILGDGSVALILDVGSIIASAEPLKTGVRGV